MYISKKIILPSVALALLCGSTTLQTVSAVNYQSKSMSSTNVSSQEINQVSISNNTDNIYVKTGSELKIDYDGPQKNAPSVQVKNKRLEITSPHHFNLNFFSRNTYNITITLPKNKLQSFAINSSNGNVTVDCLNTEKGSISTSNGDITISNLTSQLGFELSSSNGDIVVEHANASRYSLSNSNGQNKFKGMDVSNSFSKGQSRINQLGISASNGDIKVY